jgi:hypothetical protein
MKKKGEYYPKFGTSTRGTMTKISSLSNGLVVLILSTNGST